MCSLPEIRPASSSSSKISHERDAARLRDAFAFAAELSPDYAKNERAHRAWRAAAWLLLAALDDNLHRALEATIGVVWRRHHVGERAAGYGAIAAWTDLEGEGTVTGERHLDRAEDLRWLMSRETFASDAERFVSCVAQEHFDRDRGREERAHTIASVADFMGYREGDAASVAALTLVVGDAFLLALDASVSGR